MAAAPSPYDAATTATTDMLLRVQLLTDVPAQPVSLAAVAAVASPLPAASPLYAGESEEFLPGTLLSLSGSVEFSYPLYGQGSYRYAGWALVHGDPPDLVLATGSFPSPGSLDGPGAALSFDFDLLVGRQPQ